MELTELQVGKHENVWFQQYRGCWSDCWGHSWDSNTWHGTWTNIHLPLGTTVHQCSQQW